MENKNYSVEEMEWNAGVKKYLHQIKKGFDALLLVVIGLLAITGCHVYKCYGLDSALGQMATLALFVLLPAMVVACACLRDSLEKCYRQHRCTVCGHIHYLNPEELSNTTGTYHCPQCSKNTQHKMIPLEKQAEHNTADA